MNGAYEKMNIQWFPGHMTKAQRMIEQDLKLVDAVCEILDARIPRSSRNPDIDRLAGDKPRLLILNRTDLADPTVTARWRRLFESQGYAVLETDAKSGKGVAYFSLEMSAEQLATRVLASESMIDSKKMPAGTQEVQEVNNIWPYGKQYYYPITENQRGVFGEVESRGRILASLVV